MNRETRRALKRDAPSHADKLAKSCFDFQAGELVQVKDPKAIAALRRAFRRMIEAGCKPVAVPVTEREAEGFPRHAAERIEGGVSWLAVGLDPSRRGAYSLQSAGSNIRAVAHDVAKEKALANLALICAAPGFPVTPAPKEKAVCKRPDPSTPCPAFGPRNRPCTPD